MEESLRRIVELAIAEDLGEEGDITSKAIFKAGEEGAASVVSRSPCTISGLATGPVVCGQVDSNLKWLALVTDGAEVPAAAEIARIEGPLVSILAAERMLLNFLSHLCGVATMTKEAVNHLEGLDTQLAATRKTTPGLRLLEKEAVRHGGGQTHRLGLYDAVLIKDNHIAAAGGVAAAIEAVRRSLGDRIEIEVEVDNDAQLEEALAAGAGRILLDNMEPDQVNKLVKKVSGRAIIEVSGGVNIDSLRSFAEAGADIVSMGALTRDAPGIDMSLEMESRGV